MPRRGLAKAPRVGIEEQVGQLVIVGFPGTSPTDSGVKTVIAQAEAGLIGGVALYRYNIESPPQVRELVRAIHGARTRYPLFVSIDQEGGRVQRLTAKQGFQDFATAKEIGSRCTPTEARAQYDTLAQELLSLGINFNCAPCVDLDSAPPCPVIGGLERSFGESAERVATMAEQVVDAFRAVHGIACAKHFPGHGRAAGDSHTGLIDITKSWTAIELEPYRLLQARGKLDAVMTSHLVHTGVDQGTPCTFSPSWIGRLRTEIGFHGPIVSDDLHMGAILQRFPLDQVVVMALRAGHELLFFSNNPLAAAVQGVRHDVQSTAPSAPGAVSPVPDPTLPSKVQQIVAAAIGSKQLHTQLVSAAFERVRTLKQRLQSPSWGKK